MKLCILLVIITGIPLLGCFRGKTRLAILFDNAHELEIGAKVYSRGLPIGQVSSIDLAGNKIAAVITLDDGYKIPVDSKFFMQYPLLGLPSIDIQASSNTSFLSSGDTVAGFYKQPHLLDALVGDSLKRQKISESLHKIADGISGLAQAAKDTTK